MKRNTKKTQKSHRKQTQAMKHIMQQPSLTPPANRLYKDRLFHMLFSDKAALLSLYNALNGTDYDNPDDLTITTLENAIYMGMHNDVSCILFSEINLYEQQASLCPNIAFRSLLYIADTLRGLTVDNDIYSSTIIPLPTPHFVTFYNGVDPMKEDEMILKLSDAYEVSTDQPELELTVRVLNINPGHNEVLLESCSILKQYMQFVTKVRECIDSLTAKTSATPLPYMDRLRVAISEAVDYCITQGILGDFLKKHRSEVIAVTLYEYSEEEHRRIQERDKSELKEQLASSETKLAEAETNLKQSESKLAEAETNLKQSESKLAETETSLKQSESKLTQAIQNTIAMLQSMDYDDSFIRSKLCEIYQLSEADAMNYLKK
ncbi:hypothetical protein [Jutongia sp.]